MNFKRMIICSALMTAAMLSSLAMNAAPREYAGTVVPETTSTFAFITFTDIYGNYAYIARPGEIISPPIYNDQGETLKQGNLLLQYDLRYWYAVLDQYIANLKASKEVVDINKVNMHRYDKLYEQNADSLIASYNAKYAYNNSVISFLNSQAAYKQYKIQVDKYKDWAPFEGIVTDNFTTIGQTTGGYKAIKVAQLNPIAVSVKMSRDDAKDIGNNTPVKIYPLNSDKPQGIIYGRSMITDDGIQFITENYPVIDGTKVIDDDNITVIRDWKPVRHFYADRNSDVLSVPNTAIIKDKDKYFVWRAKGQKTMQPGKTIDRYFEIEKVYIQPDDKMTVVDNYEKKVALKNNGRLELYDLVMGHAPENLMRYGIQREGLKEGQKVLFPDDSYLLMPGDLVKVVIGK